MPRSRPDNRHPQITQDIPHVPATAELGRRAVLAVDDEPSILQWLTRALDIVGYDVLAATDVFVAYDILQSTKVDALVLDVRLMGHSGLEILEFVRSIDGLATLPVIVLTGASPLTEVEQETIRREGAYLFYKPEGADEIAATLARLLG